MPVPLLPASHITDRRQPHAVALVLLTVHDGRVADLVDLEFDAGLWRRARLAPHLLRLGARLPGRWLATLYFRTDRHGVLRDHPHVVELQTPPEGAPPFTWSALGRPVELDASVGRVSLRIIPRPARVRPFLVTAHATPALINQLTVTKLGYLRGNLEGESLIVEEVCALQPRTLSPTHKEECA